MRRLLLSLTLGLAVLIAPLVAEAQAPATGKKKGSGVRLSIRKAENDDGRVVERLRYDVAPGTRVQERLIIHNVGSEQANLGLYTHDLVGGRDGSVDGPRKDVAPQGMGRWLNVSQDTLTLDPGRQQIVTLTMEVPPDAAAGDHFGFFFIEFLSKEDLQIGASTQDGKASAAMTVVTRLGIPVSERVPGELKAGIELVQPTKHYGEEELAVEFGVKNTGNVLSYIDGAWTLTAPNGQVVMQDAKAEWGPVLPGNQISRFFSIRTDNPLPRGEYTLNVTLQHGSREERQTSEQSYKLTLP